MKFDLKNKFFFLFSLQKIERAKCKNNVILHKKLQIKNIIDNFREFIEVCGSNYSEKTMNALKKHLTKQEDLFCDEEDDKIECLEICIESLNNFKKQVF